MNSKLFYYNSGILKHSSFNSIETLYNLYSTINKNKLSTFSHISLNSQLNKSQLYNKNQIMTKNICLSCFPCIKIQKEQYSNSNENLINAEGQNVNQEDPHKKCIFCHLDKNRIIYEDDMIIAFHDIRPAAKVHILIIPREHIANVKDLTYKDHKEILERMRVAGVKILKEQGYSKPCLKNENHKISDQIYDGSETKDGKEVPIPNTLLISNKEYDSILGFHIPPFTSVSHLHLHLLGLPFKNWVKSCKYKSIRFPHYFESIDNIIEELKKKDKAAEEQKQNKEKVTVSTNEQQKINKEHIIDIDSKPNSTSSSSTPVETTPMYPKQPEMKTPN